MTTNPDWDAIRNEYISDNVSQRDLSIKYDVSRGSIASRARSENWMAMRNEIAKRATDDVIERTVKVRAEAEILRDNLALKILKRLNHEFDGLPENYIGSKTTRTITESGTGASGNSQKRKTVQEIDISKLINAFGALAKSVSDATPEQLKLMEKFIEESVSTKGDNDE